MHRQAGSNVPHEQVGPALRKKRLTGPPEHVRERGCRGLGLRV